MTEPRSRDYDIERFVSDAPTELMLRILMQRGVIGTFDVFVEFPEEIWRRAPDAAAADARVERRMADELGAYLMHQRHAAGDAVRRRVRIGEGTPVRIHTVSLALVKTERPEWL